MKRVFNDLRCSTRPILVYREADFKGGAPAGRCAIRGLAAVSLGYRANDRQSQAGPAIAARPRGLVARERFERPLRKIRRKARAGVLDTNDNRSGQLEGRYFYTSRRGVAARIFKERQQRLGGCAYHLPERQHRTGQVQRRTRLLQAKVR